jgi:hypothetical protein
MEQNLAPLENLYTDETHELQVIDRVFNWCVVWLPLVASADDLMQHAANIVILWRCMNVSISWIAY